MKEEDIVSMLEECMDLEEGTLSADTVLSSIEEWDSLTVLSFMALLDERFGILINNNNIRNAVYVKDIIKSIIKRR